METTLQAVKEVGLPVVLILFGAWFLVARLWPWFVEADARRSELANVQAKTLEGMRNILARLETMIEHTETVAERTEQSLGEHRAKDAKAIEVIHSNAEILNDLKAYWALGMPLLGSIKETVTAVDQSLREHRAAAGKVMSDTPSQLAEIQSRLDIMDIEKQNELTRARRGMRKHLDEGKTNG